MTENNSARPVLVTYEPRILRSMAEARKVCVFSYGAKSCQAQIAGLNGSLRSS